MECKVCLAPETGLHYQIKSCRACAAFFRRTVRRRLRYKCNKKENCDVTYKNRYSCRFCRMKKCLALGMTMSDVPATSFDFHLDVTDEIELEDSSQDEDQFYTLENVIGNPNNFLQGMQQRIRNIFELKSLHGSNLPYSLSLCQQIAVARSKYAQKWPNCTKEKIFHDGIYDFNRGMCDFYKVVEYSAEFCMGIQPFAELPHEQKQPVFKHFLERFFQMERVFATADLLGNNLNDTRMVAVTGEIVDFSTCILKVAEIANISEEQFRAMILICERKINNLFMTPYKKLHADQEEINFLFGYCMWSLEGVNDISEETIMKSERIRERLSEELCMHYKYDRNIENYASRMYKLINLIIAMDRITEMREEDCRMSKVFQMFNVEVHIGDITGR